MLVLVRKSFGLTTSKNRDRPEVSSCEETIKLVEFPADGKSYNIARCDGIYTQSL